MFSTRVSIALLAAALGTSLMASEASAKPRMSGNWQDRIDFLLAPGYRLIDGDYANDVADTLIYSRNRRLNLYTDIPAINDDGTVNAVIEIPAGDNDKWETDTETGRLFWELKNGAPRTVKYLGYPGNYGMIPQTLGGDGDPLDVVVIGSMALRGSIESTMVIGVFHLIDGGDVDDKLIAVLPGAPLGEVTSMAELDGSYPGVSSILETWLTNYKGPDGGLESDGFGDVGDAMAVLDAAVAAYQ